MAHATPDTPPVRSLQGHDDVTREVERLFDEARDAVHVVASTDGLDAVVAAAEDGRRRGTRARVGLVVPSSVRGRTKLTEVEDLFDAGITIVEADLRLTTYVRDADELLTVHDDPGGIAFLTRDAAFVHDVLAFLRLAGHHTTHPT